MRMYFQSYRRVSVATTENPLPRERDRWWLTVLVALLFAGTAKAQDTFSIVAVDPETGEVGSAGATCLDSATAGTSALIISWVQPGLGAVHTQSFWNAQNQDSATARMLAGDSPSELMTWLEANDAEGTPELRQYGAVDFDPMDGSPRAAAFTGADCFDEKDHELGPNYAIQGNILINRDVLDSMAIRFFFEPGDLADKLMAALQGANRPGADSRCLSEGVSSRSAFIRVAKPDDHPDSLYLDLVVGQTDFGVEPIDVLQDKYDNWRTLNPPDTAGSTAIEAAALDLDAAVWPHPVVSESRLRLPAKIKTGTIVQILDLQGRLRTTVSWSGQDLPIGTWALEPGRYELVLRHRENQKKIGHRALLVHP